MMLIGLGWSFMGGVVSRITRDGIFVRGTSLPSHNGEVFISQEDAEKFQEKGKFSDVSP